MARRRTATATAEESTLLDNSPETFDEELWARGDLEHLVRRHKQLEIYNACHRWIREKPHKFGPIVINSHRKLGKSFFLDLFLWERCLRRPSICRFLAPSYKQGRQYLFDIHRQLERICPPYLRPAWSGDTLVFRNPYWQDDLARSTLELVGVKDGGDAARGPRANVIVCDEVREWGSLEYIITDVLIWQFIDQEEPLLILSTTPPDSMAHLFVVRYIPEAKTRGTYFLFPAETTNDFYQPWYSKEPLQAEGNRDFSKQDEEMLVEECHGKDTVSYKREALCKLISNPEGLLIPEFSPLKELIVKEMVRPRWFTAYVAIDFGWQDYNAVIFAYLDFLRRKLCCEDELWMHNTSTGLLAKRIREKEEELYGWMDGDPIGCRDEKGRKWRYRDIVRVGDHSKQQLCDLWFDHDVAVRETEKWDRDAALANFRFGFQNLAVEIHPRCVHLIEQCEHGSWKETLDGARKDFSRNSVLGHCDMVAAGVYLYRSVAWEDNPIPMPSHDPAKEFLYEEDPPTQRIVTRTLDLDWKPIR